jgi:hypothetical protein
MNGQSRLLGDGGERILNTIKRNPEGLLLLAAGAVLLMRTNALKTPPSPTDEYGRRVRRRGVQASEGMEDAARETMDTAQAYASSAAEARETMDTARSYGASASEVARETVETARSQYAGQARRVVGEQSERVIRQTRSMAQGVLRNQPLAIAVAGLAAGAALAAAFPPTQLERDTLGPMGDQMSKAAERVGDQLKQATMKAGEKLKNTAEERGLDSDGLKEMASEVADTFRTSMTGHPENKGESASSAPGSAGSRERS